MSPVQRTRRDNCPGILRAWHADDGALVRIRLPGGRISAGALAHLTELAEVFGNGRLYLTSRANVQIRGISSDLHVGKLAENLTELGLLPSAPHDRIRNIMASPLSGITGGKADISGLASQLDELLLADMSLVDLPGRFLFVLDDGRGDLIGRDLDLGLVAVDSHHGQLRIGAHVWGETIHLDNAAQALHRLAAAFIRARGDAPDAPWHVDELTPAQRSQLGTHRGRDERTEVYSDPPTSNPIPADAQTLCAHHRLAEGILDTAYMTSIQKSLALGCGDTIIISPWRSLFIPDISDRHLTMKSPL